MRFNLLMLTDVIKFLLNTTHHVALVRSAGWVGSQAFQENVERDRVPMYGHIPASQDNSDDKENDPTATPCSFALVPISVNGLVKDANPAYQHHIHLQTVVVTMPAFLDSMPPDLDQVLVSNMSMLVNNNNLHVNRLVFIHNNNRNGKNDSDCIGMEYSPSNVETRLANSLNPVQIYFTSTTTSSSSHPPQLSSNEKKSESFPPCAKVNTREQQQFPVSMLSFCEKLETIDFGAASSSNVFAGLSDINSCFVSGCESLLSIDLSPFANVTNIGCEFLDGCTSIKEIDLSPLVNVTISFNFMRGCTSLIKIDCSVFSHVTEIQWKFLGDCTSLQTINLSGFINVDTIEWGFLNRCSSLLAVDLSAFQNVTTIEEDFLSKCDALRLNTTSTTAAIDMTAMGKLKELPDGILQEYSNPGQVVAPAHLQGGDG